MAATAETLDGSPYRVLVVANEPVDESAVRKVRERARGRPVAARVVAPALSPPFKEGLGDVDAGIDRAQNRLAQSLAVLEHEGIDARGEVGDVDPQLAVEDALRELAAEDVSVDEVIVASPEGEGADRIGDPAEHPERGWSLGGNWPQTTIRERATVLVGIVGTLVLLLLAAVRHGSGNVAGADAARILIATGAFLISLWHIVAILFFESVRYRGEWERAAEGLVLVGVPVAIVVSLLL